MSTDRTGDHGPQGASATPNETSFTFLDVFSGFDRNTLWMAGSVPGGRDLRSVSQFSDDRLKALPDDERHHITAVTYPPGLNSRDDAKATSVPFIVLDDIGKQIAAPPGSIPITARIEIDEASFVGKPEPSWIMETSEGNHQYGFHFDPPLSPSDGRAVIRAFKRDPVFKAGVHSLGQFFRLPSGTNTKPGRKAFRTVLKAIGPSYTLDEFVAGFGISLVTPDPVAAPVSSSPASGWTEEATPETVKAILDMIPNDSKFKDRSGNGWIRVAHAIDGAIGREAGRDLWLDWCAKWTDPKGSDPVADAKAWDTLNPSTASASTLRIIVEECHGKKSKAYEKASGMLRKEQAQAAFNVIDPADIPGLGAPSVSASKKAKDEFDDLLKEARGLVKVPAHFQKSRDDVNWLEQDVFVDAFKLAATIQPGSPTVFAPFDRGVVSTRTGAPFSGKSLLMLDQMAGFCAGRPDLMGHGYTVQSVMFAGDILYFCNEDSQATVVRRLQAWTKRHGVSLNSHRLVIVRSGLLSKKGDATAVECLRVLRTAVTHLKAGNTLPMIVIDTLATSVTGVEENSAKEMGEVMEMLKGIASAFWAAVVFIHHGTKVSGNGVETLATSLRGSGALGGVVRGADVVRTVDGKEKTDKGWAGRKVIGCRTIKASDDDMIGERYYEIETVQVDSKHAETGMLVAKGMPVCVPLLPITVSLFAGLADIDEKARQLDEAMAVGPVWALSRPEKSPAPTGRNVHEIWNVEVKIARQIVETWIEEGRYRIERTMAGKGYRDRVLEPST